MISNNAATRGADDLKGCIVSIDHCYSNTPSLRSCCPTASREFYAFAAVVPSSRRFSMRILETTTISMRDLQYRKVPQGGKERNHDSEPLEFYGSSPRRFQADAKTYIDFRLSVRVSMQAPGPAPLGQFDTRLRINNLSLHINWLAAPLLSLDRWCHRCYLGEEHRPIAVIPGVQA